MYRRSELGGHYAGTGMVNPDYNDETEMYRNKKVHVRLTTDPDVMKKDQFDHMCSLMSGAVKTYYIDK